MYFSNAGRDYYLNYLCKTSKWLSYVYKDDDILAKNIKILCGTSTVAWCAREPIIMSHSLLWRHIVLLTVAVYSSNHRVLYTIVINMTRRFKKSVGPSIRLSVCLSVRLFATLKTTAYSSFIIDSRKITRIWGERAYHSLQENEAIFSKFLNRVYGKLRICI